MHARRASLPAGGAERIVFGLVWCGLVKTEGWWVLANVDFETRPYTSSMKMARSLDSWTLAEIFPDVGVSRVKTHGWPSHSMQPVYPVVALFRDHLILQCVRCLGGHQRSFQQRRR